MGKTPRRDNGSNGAARMAEERKYILGQSRIYTPEVIDDIHVKAELGRYRMRGFSKIGRAHV